MTFGISIVKIGPMNNKWVLKYWKTNNKKAEFIYNLTESEAKKKLRIFLIDKDISVVYAFPVENSK